jgi:hypothetical protein
MLALAAVGLALLVVAISTLAGGSNYKASGRATAAVQAGKPGGSAAPAGKAKKDTATTVKKSAVAAAQTRTPRTPAPAPATAAKPNSAVPQQNGGDADPDNNGGPDDGDGGIYSSPASHGSQQSQSKVAHRVRRAVSDWPRSNPR